MIEKFEPLFEPYDRYAVSNMGYVLDRDTGLTVWNSYEDNGKPYVVLEGSHNKTRKFFIANLVAESFVLNKDNLGYLYYKDGDVNNTHCNNLGWAINPQEGKQRVARPLRKKVENRRHRLIIEINKCIDKDKWDTAKRLGKELWELEGNQWSERNTPSQY
nr:MAG TPA: PROTEIN/DNA Complex catalytic motif, Helix-turn-helix DNA [Caudoviricetes sp.]